MENKTENANNNKSIWKMKKNNTFFDCLVFNPFAEEKKCTHPKVIQIVE